MKRTILMDCSIINQKEAGNTGQTIHCHYHPESDTWIAYGKSAYALQHMIERADVVTIVKYSTELDMMSIKVGRGVLRDLCQSNNVAFTDRDSYICITSTTPFNTSDYENWAVSLKLESSQKGHSWVQTPVSDKLPREEFINDGMNTITRSVKRMLDIIFSAMAITFFAPLFLITYIMVKSEDGGPALFKQERIGRFGRPFYIYKFRSMRIDAEKDGPQLSHSGGADDPRLTKVGRFIRLHHLDELPQLWNVLKGDMAFVGPRPERKFYIDMIMQYDKRYEYLYQIRPGVTSYATLYNGYTDTMEKMLRRLEYDLYYLGHRSWWFDIKILFYTFCSIVFGKRF